MRRLLIIGVSALALLVAVPSVATGSSPWKALADRVLSLEQHDERQDVQTSELRQRVMDLEDRVAVLERRALLCKKVRGLPHLLRCSLKGDYYLYAIIG